MSRTPAGVPDAVPTQIEMSIGFSRRRPSLARRGLGLIELLTVVALLIVALALVVATARHVRSNSANELTRKRLQALVDETSRLIVRDRLDPTLPLPAGLEAIAAPADPDREPTPAANLNGLEATLQQFARDSSDRLAQLRAPRPILDGAGDASPAAPGPLAVPAPLAVSLLGGGGASELRDAWGRPIALIPRQVPSVGIAPDDGPFFVSAGPDGQFLTLSDNLYSYDLPALLPTAAPATPRARPGSGAVRLRDRADESTLPTTFPARRADGPPTSMPRA